MPEKDKQLIEKARNIHYTQWSIIGVLIDEAETPEAKEQLRIIQNAKYHEEEYRSGLD